MTPPQQEKQQESVSRFFQDIESRAWTDAEKELDNIRQHSENTDWSKGYVKALEGLLLTFRTNDDKYIFLPRVLANRSDETIKTLIKEYSKFASNELHGDYDRGFFKALEEYLSTLAVQKPIVETKLDPVREMAEGKTEPMEPVPVVARSE